MLKHVTDRGHKTFQDARRYIGTTTFAWRLYSAVKPSAALMLLAVTAVVLRMEYVASSARVDELERLVLARLLLTTPRADAIIEFEAEILEGGQDHEPPEDKTLAIDHIFFYDSGPYSYPITMPHAKLGRVRFAKLDGTENQDVVALRRQHESHDIFDADYMPFALRKDGPVDLIVSTDYPYWSGFDHLPAGEYGVYLVEPRTRRLRGPVTRGTIDAEISDRLAELGVAARDPLDGYRDAQVRFRNRTVAVPTFGLALPVPTAMIGFAWASLLAAAGLLLQCSPRKEESASPVLPEGWMRATVGPLLNAVAGVALVMTIAAPVITAGVAIAATRGWGLARDPVPMPFWWTLLAILPGLLGVACTLAAARLLLVRRTRVTEPIDTVD
ncbi:MAG: hypothetical protein KIT19_14560 [Phycisphaeraceae bacterium]|nr:hypothetical protein [Phycisphaeraceae bacterium]